MVCSLGDLAPAMLLEPVAVLAGPVERQPFLPEEFLDHQFAILEDVDLDWRDSAVQHAAYVAGAAT